jgi:hypothetical protein
VYHSNKGTRPENPLNSDAKNERREKDGFLLKRITAGNRRGVE